MSARKRIPGESNTDYQRGKDPNAGFLGTHSVHRGGDLSFVYRAISAFTAWRGRRRVGRS